MAGPAAKLNTRSVEVVAVAGVWRVVDEQVMRLWTMVASVNERERVVGKAPIWLVDLRRRELGATAADIVAIFLPGYRFGTRGNGNLCVGSVSFCVCIR